MFEPEEIAGNMQEFSLVCQRDIEFADPGDDVVLSCQLQPAMSAASMEIKWKYRGDLICHYKDGQVTVSEGYEDKVSLSLLDLKNGDVSLKLRDIRSLQRGAYTCEVISEWQAKKEYIFLHLSSENFRLVAPYTISADPGENVTLPFILEPETNAVSMKMKWLKHRELLYECKYGKETANPAYVDRVNLSTQEIERGNLSLTLRNVQPSDTESYTCKVFYDGNSITAKVILIVRDKQKRFKRNYKRRALELIKPVSLHEDKCLSEKKLKTTVENEPNDRLPEVFPLRRTSSLKNIPPNMEGESSRSISSPGVLYEAEPQSSTSRIDIEASALWRQDEQEITIIDLRPESFFSEGFLSLSSAMAFNLPILEENTLNRTVEPAPSSERNRTVSAWGYNVEGESSHSIPGLGLGQQISHPTTSFDDLLRQEPIEPTIIPEAAETEPKDNPEAAEAEPQDNPEAAETEPQDNPEAAEAEPQDNPEAAETEPQDNTEAEMQRFPERR